MRSRAVVVTGAGSGIGRAIVAAFAQMGDSVFAFDISKDGVKETAEQLSAHDVRPYVGDVSRYEDLESVVDAAAAEHDGQASWRVLGRPTSPARPSQSMAAGRPSNESRAR